MRILIIGTGSIGRRHAEVAAGDGHEVAVCDISSESAKETAENLQLNDYYSDYTEALEHGFDAAIISTPNMYHVDPGVLAMSKGCHVFMEKPITVRSEEAERLVAASKKFNKILMVGYVLRVFPGLEEVKTLLVNEALGRKISARVKVFAAKALEFQRSDYRKSYETGGGIIYDYSHEIDYLRYFFGNPIRLACFKDLLVRDDKSCDDIAEIIMQFENRVIVNVHMNYVLDGGRELEIICENGLIQYNFSELRITKNDGAEEYVKYEFERNDMYLKQLRNFTAACRGMEVNYVTGENALETLKICEELYSFDKETLG